MVQSKPSLLQSPVLKIALGILLILLLFIAFIPQLTSTAWVSGKLKQEINNKIPGQLNFSSIKLAWMGTVKIQDLQYEDTSQGIGITVEEISTSKGLLSLVTNYKDGGIITIENPLTKIYIKETPPPSASQKNSDTIKKQTETTAQKRPKDHTKKQTTPLQLPPLPPVNVQLNIVNGTLIAVEPDNTEKPIIEALDLQLKLDGPAGAVDYQLSFKNGQAQGEVSGKGDLLLPQGATPDLDALQSNALLQISDWQISDLLTLAASRANAPKGEGVIHGDVKLTGNGLSKLALAANLAGRDIKLHGGPLLSDTPSIDTFLVDLSLLINDKEVEVEALTVDSPFLTANVSAKTSDTTVQTLSATAKIDLAEIFRQFPATLTLQEGMKVSEGMIDIDTKLDTVDADLLFQASAHLKRLAGTAGTKKIALNKPININVTGKKGAQSIELEQLLIESSFITANGSGNKNGGKLAVNADIGDALKEAQKFIDLGGLVSDGKLKLNLDVINAESNVREVKGSLDIAGFELSHDGVSLYPKNKLSTTFASTLQFDNELVLQSIGQTNFNFGSWYGEGSLTTDGLTVPNDSSPAAIKNGVLNSTLRLERVTTLLHSIQALPKEQTLSGPLKLQMNIGGENIEKPEVQVSMNISPFSLKNKDQLFSDDDLNVTLKAQADIKQNTYTLSNFSFSSLPVGLNVTGTMLPENNEQLVSVKGTSKLDLVALSKQLQTYAGLELEMTGLSEKPFQLTTITKDGQWIDTPKHTEFSTSIHADTVVGYGLNIETLDLPIQLHDSIAEADFKAQVNKGTMTVKPKIDFSGIFPVASLPENSTILQEVGLTGDMSEDLLAKIHPLFKGVATTAGTVSLDMPHFNWPLGEEQQKDVTFESSFTFNDVKLQAGSLLSPLLAIMKVEDDTIMLSETPMSCVGENERITCSPLEATVNEHSLILEGSVGFDQSLDYVAKIPVTSKMVSSKIYKYLEGTSITVPIAGTVSKPSISKSFIQKALGDLVLQAGQKQLGDQAGKLLQNLFK